ncbi:MAG: hypothetical protein HYY18_12445 [Planctomycetes bacterium]|nr:hypothetical protein [Planctomycetota bacterium]
MRIRSLAVLALAASCVSAETPLDPQTEWPKKRDALYQKAGREHAAIAKWAASKKLFNEAHPEWAQAAELDPTNAEAQKALGRKLENGAWVDDPKNPPKKGAEAPAASVPGLLEELDKKRREAGKKLSKDFLVLADWAQKAGLRPESIELWRRVVDRYDPASEKARLGLGHVKQGDVWVPPDDVARRDAAAGRLKDAPRGEAVAGKSEVEQALGVSHAKRRSKHFFVEGPWTDAQIAELVQVAETSREIFLEMFDRDADDFPDEIHAMIYKDNETYARYVQADPAIGKEWKKAYAAAGGYPVLSPPAFAGFQGPKDWEYVRDFVSHMTVHVLFCQLYAVFPYPAWLYEGISYWVTDRLLHSAKLYCSGFSTSAGGGRDFEDMREWKAEMKRLEREGLDPGLGELFASDLTGMNMRRSMKAWSVVDWLVAEKKEGFKAFVAELSRGSRPEDAAKEALGVSSLSELDGLWEKYVRAKY